MEKYEYLYSRCCDQQNALSARVFFLANNSSHSWEKGNGKIFAMG
ncbi:MAG: hypothetical protein WCT05_01330 [Lentisphaeria bacterium]